MKQSAASFIEPMMARLVERLPTGQCGDCRTIKTTVTRTSRVFYSKWMQGAAHLLLLLRTRVLNGEGEGGTRVPLVGIPIFGNNK